MPTRKEDDAMYMGTAMLHAGISKGVRLKVGALLVTTDRILIGGVNGLPAALGNVLEYEEDGKLVTKPEVIHAEQACLNKAARAGVTVANSRMYVTHLPCRHCCTNMIAVGISEVIYKETYRDNSGLDLLKEANVLVYQYKE